MLILKKSFHFKKISFFFSTKTHYQILEIDSNASSDIIKQNYHKLAKKHHPDFKTDKNEEEYIKEINLAYKVLMDPKLRKEYDDSLIPDSEYFTIKILGIKFNLKYIFGFSFICLIFQQIYSYKNRQQIKKGCPLSHEQRKETMVLEQKYKKN